jgi:malate permease and related proteins
VVELVLSILVDDLVPIFVVAAVGFALARVFHIDVRSLSRVTFNALAPCLVFNLLVTSPVGPAEAGRVAVFTVMVVVGIGLVAWLAAVPFRLSRADLSAFLIVVMFSNAGNYGLSVVLFAFGREHLARAALYFVVNALLMFTLGVVVASSGRQGVGQALRGVFRVPALYGVLAASAVLWSGVTLPPAVSRPVDLLASAAIPAMLLVLGMQLERGVWPERPGLVAMAALLTLVVTPVLGLGLVWALGLEGPARQALIVQTGMPSAVITTILALEFDVAPSFVTAVVVATTALSPVTVTMVIAVAKSLP